jgi:hypothetical protein
MKIFDKVKKTTIASRRIEEKLYEIALDEVENNQIKKGLYAKALAKAEGDKVKADGIYLKLRVQSIMDDIESEKIDRREDARIYEAVQAYKEFESINVKSERPNSLFTECQEMLGNKGYKLHRSTSGEYHIGTGVEDKDLSHSIYSSKDLEDIRKKASKLLRN